MRNFVYILILTVTTLQAQTPMTAAEAVSFREKVSERATAVKTITSNFTQRKHLGFLSNDIVSGGKLAFKAPDKVKWEYTEPFEYTVVFRDEMLYINDSGKKSQVDMGSSKMFGTLNDLIVKSIRGDMFDDNKFSITYFKKEKRNEVRFSPKDESFKKHISAFLITFDTNGDVTGIKMTEPSGDYTHITFSNRTVNQPLDDAIFTN
ncbi:outer membrane lipoprotein carrier protein LolA [Sinomicrobium kalidii]|uniref:LolA family protein n=1 Tax=Sinomicrobium kalidii TaxID=2900738 RepID=UPI001E61BE3B|nr:outer membrane lipoprotein carrier protein LolA [Sinomicrobium kalidii]UGU15784.1 outer membrane lipoprotein carrier protein LolA [Sinomicrobium kalidii]